MAWPKLRNKSSGSLMTASNRSGATHDGARSHGGAAQAASGPDAPAAWPGSVEGPMPVENLGSAAFEDLEPIEGEVVGADVGVADPESADLPLWDWSPPGESLPEDESAAQSSDPPRSE